MKIWIAMCSGNDAAWSQWTSNLAEWLKDTMTTYASGCDGPVRMAEFQYRYERHGRKTREEGLGAACVLDGWLKHAQCGQIWGDHMPMGTRNQLLQTFNQHPEGMMQSSSGDFTLSVWDRERETLCIGSDVYGSRPIYYWISPEQELFVSSDLRALLHVHHIPFDIDYERCLLYLSSQYAVGENNFEANTFFKGICKIPAATIARWNNGRWTLNTYWGMHNLLNLENIQQDAAPMFRNAMIEAVGDRLHHSTSIVEVSGGLDSAAVLAAAIAGGHKERVLGVNISFSGEDMVQSNDMDLVRRLFQDLQMPSIIILGDNTLKMPNAELGRDPLWFLDGPDPRANVLINEMYTAIANEFGTDAGLTGEGGDFLFTGEEYVLDSLIRQRKWKEMLHTLWAWSDHKLGKAIQLGAAYGLAPFIPVVNDRMYYKLAWSDSEYEMPEYFTQAHMARERSAQRDDYMRYKQSKPFKYWGKRYHYDYTWPRASYLDAVGVSMQSMHPFFDRRMMELSFSVPTEQHYDVLRGEVDNYYGTKMLIRKAFTDILPTYLHNRVTKTSYAHMARKSLLNERSNLLQLFDRSEKVLLHQLEVINKHKFWEHLLGTLIRVSDTNNDLGMSYQYLRMVISMEIWLREMSKGKAAVLERAKPRSPRWLADIEIVGELQQFKEIKNHSFMTGV
ncbi:asparagine synthase-related protein [Paenibacillus glucanolyticus]|uniref:asparagine synthase-related protein n=1 Tax=Paenibacillus glucanolyticus TaxID=59843 RepID=UPI00128C2E44|nr:asparagine synthase-related protein [Paenibacillus glucanolyticus]MPY19702.1 asparagine synthase [Paenibacillus glucanolyticus]